MQKQSFSREMGQGRFGSSVSFFGFSGSMQHTSLRHGTAFVRTCAGVFRHFM
ncbi:MAG: hypothetical protein IKD06_04075 [Clostridia bacterium]|nr:hypothetical protein [Clostridia bacterium]